MEVSAMPTVTRRVNGKKSLRRAAVMHLDLQLLHPYSTSYSIPTPSLLHPYSIPTPPLLHPYSTPTPPLLHPYSTPTPPPSSALLHPTPPYSTLLHHPTPPYSTLLHPTPPYSTLLHPYSIPAPSPLHIYSFSSPLVSGPVVLCF